MQTVGVVGLGRIGLPICENLIKSGFRVLGYRRSAMTAFENIGGVPARSPAEIGAAADFILSCLPTTEAMDEVMQGPQGLIHTARAGQIIVELGSHPVAEKQRYVAPFDAEGAAFVDGEVSGTPPMVLARQAVIYLGGDPDACKRLQRVVAGFADSCLYFGPFGTASKVKLINNLLVAVHIAAAAEAMALGLKTGIDVDLMIQAIATGSGGSSSFAQRAPRMAKRQYEPPMGTARLLSHYFDMIGDLAAGAGAATPMLDRAVEIYRRAIATGYGDKDVAAVMEVIEAWPQDDSPRISQRQSSAGSERRNA
jgi:3-hydroxyisobutyrate dehydrogenase-like beta-hydroxyacid dehydrogenase